MALAEITPTIPNLSGLSRTATGPSTGIQRDQFANAQDMLWAVMVIAVISIQ